MKKDKYTIPGNLSPFGFTDEAAKDQDFNFEVIDQCIEVIQLRLDPIRSINKNASSYGLKHLFEDYIGEYVSNGDLIVAMLTCGYRYERSKETPNCFFNVSQHGVNLVKEIGARNRSNRR